MSNHWPWLIKFNFQDLSEKGAIKIYLLRLKVEGFLRNLLDDRLDLVEALLDARHKAAPRGRALLLRDLR